MFFDFAPSLPLYRMSGSSQLLSSSCRPPLGGLAPPLAFLRLSSLGCRRFLEGSCRLVVAPLGRAQQVGCLFVCVRGGELSTTPTCGCRRSLVAGSWTNRTHHPVALLLLLPQPGVGAVRPSSQFFISKAGATEEACNTCPAGLVLVPA